MLIRPILQRNSRLFRAPIIVGTLKYSDKAAWLSTIAKEERGEAVSRIEEKKPDNLTRFTPPKLSLHQERKTNESIASLWLNNIDIDDLPIGLKQELEATLLSAINPNSPPILDSSSLSIKQRIARLAFVEFSNRLARGEITQLDEKEEAKSLLTLAASNGEGNTS